MGSSTRTPLEILILGGGVVGLTTAIALANHPSTKHHRVTVLERYQTYRPEVGSAVGLWPNANRVLDYIGVYEDILKKCVDNAATRNFRRWEDGEVLTSLISGNMKAQFGYPVFNIHRAPYHQSLLDAAKKHNVDVRMGCEVVELDPSTPSLTLSSGEVLKADLIVGADGLNSITRRIIHPDMHRLDSLMDLYYCSVPASLLEADPELAPLLTSRDFWWGPNAGVVTVCVRSGDADDDLRYYLEFPHFGDEGVVDHWNKAVDAAHVKELFKGWDPRVMKLLDLAAESGIYNKKAGDETEDLGKFKVWRMAYHDPEPSWVAEEGDTKGKVILLGDAAHAMLPHTGQGGAIGIEDSVALVEAIARLEPDPQPEDLYKVLKAWEAIRKPRATFLSNVVKHLTHLYHIPDGPEQQQRDHRWRTVAPKGPPPKPQNMNGAVMVNGRLHIDDPPENYKDPSWPLYIAGYDTVDHTNRKLDEILSS